MTAIPSGANAEDCPHCLPGTVTVYPWICPGHPEPVAAEPTLTDGPIVQIDLDAFRGLVDVAHNLGRKHLDCDQYAAMHLVVRQAPALLALVEQREAEVVHLRAADGSNRRIAVDLEVLVGDLRAENERLRRERGDFRDAWKSAGDRATKAKAQRDVLLAETVQQDRRIADLEAHILRLCSCMDPPAIDRRCFVHGDPPASTWRLARDRTRAAEHEAERLEAELAAARAEIADHEREAETTGRIIGDLEAINGDVSGENAKLRAGLGEGIAAVTEADERVLRANAVVNEAQAAMNGMAAERDEARAETEAVRAIVGGWISDANDGYGSDPNDLAGLLEAHDASGAPESPADATALPRTPDA